MDCNECGDKAYRCQRCDGKACQGCGGLVCKEAEHATCGDCEDKALRVFRMPDRKFENLVPWFPRPQVSFPNGVDQ